jgi:hypothetical protein
MGNPKATHMFAQMLGLQWLDCLIFLLVKSTKQLLSPTRPSIAPIGGLNSSLGVRRNPSVDERVNPCNVPLRWWKPTGEKKAVIGNLKVFF